jgi:ArsR family transcriptional regulator
MRNKQIKSLKESVKTAKALADKSRMRIITALMYREELCVCQVTELLGFAPSTVSRHISLLEGAGLVKSRKVGRWVYYRLSNDIPAGIEKWLNDEAFNTPEAADDRNRLDKIISCNPEDLCRNVKKNA